MVKYLASFWSRGSYRQGFVEAETLREAKIKAGRKYGDVIEVFEWLPEPLR
jgi:hypothetical protein